ncbi:MAG: hypothetical protein HKN86_03265 [Acidimicrobiia bacterium]|nr:hypothetical protein [Acidimicrobiia bacterium]
MGKFLIANVKNYVRKRDPDNLTNQTYIVIDEAPVFVGSGKSYEDILSQKRKYGLYSMIACQYSNQFGKATESVKFNTAVKIISGDNQKDFSSLMSIPSKFLVSDQDGKLMNKIKLDEYQFLASSKTQEMFRFNSESDLITSNKHFRTSVDQKDFEEIQIESFYKSYVVEQRAILDDFTLTLEPLKTSGKSVVLPSLNVIKESKEIMILKLLAKYKFLTSNHLVYLGVASFQSGLPTSSLEKNGFIKSTREKLSEKDNSFPKVFFLTKKGAKRVDAICQGELKVNYPSARIGSNISNIMHKMAVINFQIELSRFNLEFCTKDIDNVGTQNRNQRATRISWGSKKLEPDMVFCINHSSKMEYFTLEVERLSDVKKSFKKIIQHLEMNKAQAFQKQFKFTKDHRSLWVFEKKATLDGVIGKCLSIPKFPIEQFLFKLEDRYVYDNWTNINYQTRNLFYI